MILNPLKTNSILFFLILCISAKLSAQNTDQIVIGNKYQIHSEVLNETRYYSVYLPSSYQDSPTKKYPILIVLDGDTFAQPLFTTVNYLGSDYLRDSGIPQMIVVGISNINRRRDFTPDKVVTSRPNDSGGGKLFLQFIQEELLVSINNHYRTSDLQILFGHSLGGLLALHTYLEEDTPFDAFLAIDPSLGTWDTEVMNMKVEQKSAASSERFLYIASANWGKRNLNNRDRHLRLFDLLDAKTEGDFLGEIQYFEEENHRSAPMISFYYGIREVFKYF